MDDCSWQNMVFHNFDFYPFTTMNEKKVMWQVKTIPTQLQFKKVCRASLPCQKEEKTRWNTEAAHIAGPVGTRGESQCTASCGTLPAC